MYSQELSCIQTQNSSSLACINSFDRADILQSCWAYILELKLKIASVSDFQNLLLRFLRKFLKQKYRNEIRFSRYKAQHIYKVSQLNFLKMDINLAVNQLPGFEQNVCKVLSQGFSTREAAGKLNCTRWQISMAIKHIRFHFTKLGLEKYYDTRN